MAFVVYLITLFVVGFTLTYSDIGPNTWEYWAIVVSVVMAHLSGREIGH